MIRSKAALREPRDSPRELPRFDPGQGRIVRLALDLLMVAGGLWVVCVLLHLATTHGPSYRWPTVAWLSGGGVVALFAFRRLAPFGLQRRAVALALGLATLEGTLQLLALAGLLPGVDLHTYCPFGRSYVTSEGSGNSVCNRYGWYYPSMRARVDVHRVALVGDSFIHGLGVQPRQNLGIVLEELLADERSSSDVEVLAFGVSGAGPAQYLELLRYAHRRFDIESAVLCIFVGNDFRNVSLEIQGVRPDAPPDRYIYYRMGADGEPALVPQSRSALHVFRAALEDNHRRLPFSLARTLRSHVLSAPVLQTALRALLHREVEPATREHGELGLDELVFQVPPSREARAAEILLQALLDKASRFAEQHGIDLRIITIPHFPSRFYEQQVRPWTTRFGDQDLLRPERVLQRWARSTDTPALFVGSELQQSQIPLDEIRQLYFQGSGHFTVQGHRFYAQKIAHAFPWFEEP